MAVCVCVCVSVCVCVCVCVSWSPWLQFRLSVDEEDIVQSLYKNLFLRAMFEDENFSVDDEDDTEPLRESG